MTIHIRTFLPADQDFVLSLVSRFTSFDLPSWRTREEIDSFNHAALQKAMTEPEAETALLVAEDETEGLAGFIYLTAEKDFFTGEKQGYISDIAVAAGFEGRGVARLLLDAADEWARNKGYRTLYLHVFAGNGRARQVYEKYGFGQEVIKYVKPLD